MDVPHHWLADGIEMSKALALPMAIAVRVSTVEVFIAYSIGVGIERECCSERASEAKQTHVYVQTVAGRRETKHKGRVEVFCVMHSYHNGIDVPSSPWASKTCCSYSR